MEIFSSSPLRDGDAKVSCPEGLSPGELVRGAGSLPILPFLGVLLISRLIPQVLEHPSVSRLVHHLPSLGSPTHWLPRLGPMWHQL